RASAMKHMTSAAATAFALLSLAGAPQPAAAQQSPINIAYEAPTDPKLQPIYERLKQRAVLEELQTFLTPLRLPRQFTVRTAQCGTVSLRYVPGGPATVCYEMVDAVTTLIAKHTKDDDFRQTVIIGAFIETVLHETAQAIFDILQIPIWGRERDAAD